ncbi:mandelate racemase/muconate lactonizing enzyme family protein [Streptomyces purpureus]|uniref:mandelate racemase/muconate lactonizing enzyme family protein n=1 Tax=Streptomyces purpureus TaxID=1951 RepID=UPI0037A68CB9
MNDSGGATGEGMGGETWELFRIAVGVRAEWLVLRLRADGAAGVYGYGECSDAGPLAKVVAVLDAAVRRGARVQRPAGLRDTLAALHDAEFGEAPDRRTEPSFAGVTVAGGMAQARTDLAARLDGVPLWSWMGGAPPAPVELYANLNRTPGGSTPQEAAATAERALADGFGALKVAPFDAPGDRPLPELGLARLHAVRQAVGGGVRLMADAHERLTFDELVPLLGPLSELGLHWLEDAVCIGRPRELARLRARTAIPLAGGEFACDPADVWNVDGLIDVLLPDVKHAGGTLEAARLAAAGTARISVHNPTGPVATLHSAHLSSVCGAAEPLEYAYGPTAWRSDLVRGAERVERGRLTLPDAPGTGLELDTAHPSVTRVWSGRMEAHRPARR